MSLLTLLSSAITPVTNLIDEMHTSDDERLQAKNALAKLHAEMSSEIVTYETQLLKSKANIISAEANGKSWLQRNWRPITMLTFLALVVCDSLGLLPFRLAEDAWDLLKIGLGGYVVGRSAEKIAAPVAKVIKG